MRINLKIDIFIENKKWLNKTIFASEKSINKNIYNFSYSALRKGILLSKFNLNHCSKLVLSIMYPNLLIE